MLLLLTLLVTKSSNCVCICLQSCIEVYNLETGCKHASGVELEKGVSCSSVGRCVQALDEGGCVVCSCGKDMYLIPCNLKLKND